MFDLAIIGGGVNGCGIARDAAGRGARVLVIEARDLASGTSSASTKLIHGGLRYLEHYEFALVREALSERERLWAIAPHIIQPLRFVLPYIDGLRPRWLLRAGLFVYDHLGGRKRLPASQGIDLACHTAGLALQPHLRRGFAYSDCWVDDARLVVLNARDAAEHGARVMTRSPVTGLARSDGHWRIATPHGSFTARAIVNAAGPAVLDVLALTGNPPAESMRLVRGSHIVVPRLFDHDYAYFFQHPDGRIFFAIPYERDFTLIGTTDVDHHGRLDQITASADEIGYLCAGASAYFRTAITPADVVWSFAGVRPLIDDGSGRPEAATRGYRLDLSGPDDGAPLLTVFGGKITTYRHLGEAACDLLARLLPVLDRPRWTAREPLPGGDFPMLGLAALTDSIAARYPFLKPEWAARLTRAYGTRVGDVLGDAHSLEACGRHFGHGLTMREVRYLIDHEWAGDADDVLWRRTKLGLRFTADQTAALAAVFQN